MEYAAWRGKRDIRRRRVNQVAAGGASRDVWQARGWLFGLLREIESLLRNENSWKIFFITLSSSLMYTKDFQDYFILFHHDHRREGGERVV